MKKRIIFVLFSLVFFYMVIALLPAQDSETGESSPEMTETQTVEEAPVFNQGTVPLGLLRPQRGDETIRYPRDTIIGELGRGTASEEAYQFARNLLQGALSLNRESALLAGQDPALLEDLFTSLQAIGAQKYRIGGGREEPDESISFLFRFTGREQTFAGEIYIRLEDETWKLDDILLEEARDIAGDGSLYPFSFSPYERFF
jgi:hypothetical protein